MIETVENMTFLWDGPISIGIFVDYHSYNVLEYLAEVHRCDVSFRRKVRKQSRFSCATNQRSLSKGRGQRRWLVTVIFKLFSVFLQMNVHFAFRRSPFQTECPLIEIPQSNRSCQEFFATRKIIFFTEISYLFKFFF